MEEILFNYQIYNQVLYTNSIVVSYVQLYHDSTLERKLLSSFTTSS